MTPPWKICLRHGCCKIVEVNDVQKTALTCGDSDCIAYMKYLDDLYLLGNDNNVFMTKNVASSWYRSVKVFDATKDTTKIKHQSDKLRAMFKSMYENLDDLCNDDTDTLTYNAPVAKKRRLDTEMQMDGESVELTHELLVRRIVQAARDIDDESFDAITDREALARFCNEAVNPLPDQYFDEMWNGRDEYARVT